MEMSRRMPPRIERGRTPPPNPACGGDDVATLLAEGKPEVALRRSEAVRVWLYETFFTNLCGVTFGDWCRVLRENRFAVDPPSWPRAAVLTAGSLLNSYYR